ncbi:hypothetical protein [Saccharopolyspora cebuensis]|uniref:Uncharacterized protein n=1 Tax=Saccharopolyspora cebuensis TaxID=418759 RepID=A0ABV4CEQ1_9PSEU
MTRRDMQLAVLLRSGQWMLDEAAYEVGGGRYSDQQRRDLAVALEELAGALRESTGNGTAPVVHTLDDERPMIVDAER